MSVEGPDIPDVHAGTTKEQNDLDKLLSAAYSCCVSKPGRGWGTVVRSVSVTVGILVRCFQYFHPGALATDML